MFEILGELHWEMNGRHPWLGIYNWTVGYCFLGLICYEYNIFKEMIVIWGREEWILGLGNRESWDKEGKALALDTIL